MSETLTQTAPAPVAAPRKYTKKELTGEHSTWCPGCGDFSVLALYYKLLEKRQYPQEKIINIAGIGCSSRFPYFVQTNGAHFIHGRALPFATGISLSRPDLHVFVFGGDGDGFSIGGNHTTHAARKNVNLTYIVMDNWVYGLTKNQTSPTSPLGSKTKTDAWGSVDQPINPIKQLLSAGATFIARTSAAVPNHLIQMMEAAADHEGFSVIECLSECIHFNPGSFDPASPKNGKFDLVPATHNVTDEDAAYKLASAPFPGYFGVFYKNPRPTKNQLEAGINAAQSAKFAGKQNWEILQASFNKLK